MNGFSETRCLSQFDNLWEVHNWLLKCGLYISEGQRISLEQMWQSLEYRAKNEHMKAHRQDYKLIVACKKHGRPRLIIYKHLYDASENGRNYDDFSG